MKLTRMIAIVGIALLIACSFNPTVAQKSHDNTLNQQMTLFTQIVRELEGGYVDSLQAEKMMRSAIDAMLATLDPYTVYYSDKETEEFKEATTGEYGGIGIRIVQYKGEPYFTSPMEGFPANRAGLRSGDRIVMVDTVSTVGKSNSFVTSLLRGEPGTSVKINVVRPYVEDSLITVEVTREKLQIPAVSLAQVDSDGIGYISLSTFSDGAAKEVENHLKAFKANKDLKGIVLDLTDNGGGLLSQAVEIAGMFLPKGTQITVTKGKGESQRRVYKTPHSPLVADVPLAVLINSGSASASEILAGAIQDLDRGILIGERSFGKGLVQSTRELPQGMLKFTTAKYYIPSGRLIQAIDYSHRTADGKALHVPDSLTHEYHTAAGRVVRDGGGLRPDVEVVDTTVSLIAYRLWEGPWLFNYANQYASKNKEIDAPETFNLSDNDYKNFHQFLVDNGFSYTTSTSSQLPTLRKMAKEEGYLSASTDSLLNALEASLTTNLEKDLKENRKQIESILVPMIAERYYYDKGADISSLRWNKRYDKAKEILLHPDEYKKILKK